MWETLKASHEKLDKLAGIVLTFLTELPGRGYVLLAAVVYAIYSLVL